MTGRSGANAACPSLGTTTPFSTEKLSQLYPNHGSFVKEWQRSTHEAVKQGWIIPENKGLLTAVAAGSDIGR